MNYSFINLITAVILSIGIIFCWQYFYEQPRIAKLAEEQKRYQQRVKSLKSRQTNAKLASQPITRTQALYEAKRIKIVSPVISGSISLKGLRFDDLTLLRYRQELDGDSNPVELFSPSSTDKAYFAEIGWWSRDKNLELPDNSSLWKTDSDELEVNKH